MSYRVNIVEDEEKLNSILKLYLEKEGYIISAFLNGSSAVENMDSPPDLWVLDIMLPDINGYTLLKKIKEEGSTPSSFFHIHLNIHLTKSFFGLCAAFHQIRQILP
jgi:two-component system response regulator CssR